MVMLIALLAVRLDGLKHAANDCSAGKPIISYDAPNPSRQPDQHTWIRRQTCALAVAMAWNCTGWSWFGWLTRCPRRLTRRSGHLRHQADSVYSAWGAPERVPPPVSSTFFDITPTISLDGLALYFGSNRPGPFSPPWPDLWVSHRASVNHPWGPAVNLGPGINTPLFEGSIDISPDQRTVFFAAVTPDFVFDIFMAWRSSSDELFGPRVRLTPPINSEGHDYGPALTPDGHTMFFSSGTDNPFAPGAINYLYVSERQNDRAPWSSRIYLDTLNCPTCFGGLPTIRAGGKEICWMGDRGDSFGDKDIYCATRR